MLTEVALRQLKSRYRVRKYSNENTIKYSREIHNFKKTRQIQNITSVILG